MWGEHFRRFVQNAEAGYGKKFTDAADLAEWSTFQKMQQNARLFAAHKQHRMIEELRQLKATGITKDEFERRAVSIMRRHNKTWLKAELQATTAAAQSAEAWRNIKQREYLYPNLKYSTAHDERVRDSHRTLDGIIKPVNDDFWKTYFPPNGWGCRCKVLQVDDEVTEDRDAGFVPPKGFRHNPGETGQVFSSDHPYFKVDSLDAEALDNQTKKWYSKLTRDAVRDWSKENMIGKELAVPQLPGKVKMSMAKVKDIIAHVHPNAPEKNNLVYLLEQALGKSTLFKIKPNLDPDKNRTIQWFYYLLQIEELEFVFNIEEVAGRAGQLEYFLYAISGRENLDF